MLKKIILLLLTLTIMLAGCSGEWEALNKVKKEDTTKEESNEPFTGNTVSFELFDCTFEIPETWSYKNDNPYHFFDPDDADGSKLLIKREDDAGYINYESEFYSELFISGILESIDGGELTNKSERNIDNNTYALDITYTGQVNDIKYEFRCVTYVYNKQVYSLVYTEPQNITKVNELNYILDTIKTKEIETTEINQF